MTRLSPELVAELGSILAEEFDLELDEDTLIIFANSLVQYFGIATNLTE